MATKKRLGHKAVVKLNGTAIGALKKFKPPTKSREKVEVTCLEDDIQDYLDSDPPDQGEFKLEVYWQPGETGNEAIDDLFDEAESDDREGTFAIEYPFDPKVTDTFSARLLKLDPNEVSSKEGIARAIEGVLTSKIARVVATP